MSPLTRFIVDMLAGNLRSRDPVAVARDYRIHPAHAAGYLRLWVGR